MGYKQVGKDFPVFLHPETNEEYALARTERSIGLVTMDFTFYFGKRLLVLKMIYLDEI